MAEEIRIWQVDKADALTEIKRSRLDREGRIEKWIINDVSLLSLDLLIIGEQVETAAGNFIDLLCIDRSGNLVVVELKRDKTPREVTAQALDYASWVKDLEAEGIEAIAERHLKGEALETAFLSTFGEELPEDINEHHAILVVASEIDDSTERIIRYLSETYGVDINAVRFQFFQAQDGREFLVRSFTVAPQEVEQNIRRRGSKRAFPTAEEVAEEASKAGVGELFRQTTDSLSQYLGHKRRKTTCAFGADLPDGRRNATVFSLVPGESSAEKGLRYQIYSRRLSECLGLDENVILKQLPPDPQRYEPWANAPEDLQGWAGYIRNDEDIQKIVDLVKKIEPQDSPVL
jgi:DNA-directed RNA polymerase subunit F